jgi:ferredoxin-NADP reductase
MIMTLQQIRPETAEASSFIITPSEPISYKPGLHMSMMLAIENPDVRGKVRTFTLSSSPTRDYFSFTTKRGPSSFKQALFGLKPGATFQMRGPSGGMFLDEADSRPRVMIAGGIGITPFHSMITYAFDKKLTIPITLLYSNKIPEEIVFRKELDAIAKENPSIKIIHTITRPQESKEHWSGRAGRVDESFIKENVPDLVSPLFYLAGPDSMVTALLGLLQTMGIPKENTVFEKFSGY